MTLALFVSASWNVFLTLSISLAIWVVFSVVSRLALSSKYRLPPGPFCWPIVGWFPFLDTRNACDALRKEAKLHGGVLGFFVGSQYVVVLDDFTATKNAFNREEFLGRPRGLIQIDPGQEAILDMEGSTWKEQRRFQVTTFRTLGAATKNFEKFILGEVSKVISSITSKQGRTLHIHHEIELSLNNVIFHLLFGKRFEADSPFIRLLSQFDEAMLLKFKVLGTGVFFPWTTPLLGFTPGFKKATDVIERMDRLIRAEIEEHDRTLDENDLRDYVDHFLLQISRPDSHPSYTIPNLIGNVKSLLTGATETTRLSLTWFLLLMAEHRDVQSKVQAEVDRVIGTEKEPEYSDRALLPYTDAAILESMCWRNIIHLNIPRKTLWDTSLCGFDIPKDTVVFQNLTSQFRSDQLWTNPDDFDPNRFLSSDGTKVDIPEHFVPFSYGKRNCSGERLGHTQLFLFAVSLLQRFRVLAPDDGLCLDVVTVFNNQQVHPFARFQSRE